MPLDGASDWCDPDAAAGDLDGLAPVAAAVDDPDGPANAAADVLVLESDCVGPSAALVGPGAVEAADRARASATPVWLVAGVGRVLPAAMWGLATARLDRGRQPNGGYEVLDLDRLVTQVVTPVGPAHPRPDQRPFRLPLSPELFRPG